VTVGKDKHEVAFCWFSDGCVVQDTVDHLVAHGTSLFTKWLSYNLLPTRLALLVFLPQMRYQHHEVPFRKGCGIFAAK
jgi:hypothetical protein